MARILMPDDDGNHHQGADGDGRGASPDPLVTAEGACCPWCFRLDEGPAPTEGKHVCQGCGKTYSTGLVLSPLWLNSTKESDDGWRWN